MKQTRFIPIETCGLQLRDSQEGEKPSREIEGRPIVFGVRSVNITPWSSTRKVYEILEHGCISQELLRSSDVILNLNHSTAVPNVLGRYRNTDKDTLKLKLRSDCIDCSCDLPNTNNADAALELIRRGDINGMSFAFDDDYEDSENGVSYERTGVVEDGKEVWIRHVKRITALYDVSIVTFPAYEQTSVGTREASDRIDAAIEEQLKREQDNQNKAEQNLAGEDAKSKSDADTEEQERRNREMVAMRLRSQRRRLSERAFVRSI